MFGLKMLDARPGFIIKFLKRSLIVNFIRKHKLSTASLQPSTGKVIINYSTDIATGQWFTITTIMTCNITNNCKPLSCSYIRRIAYYQFTCRRLQTGSRKLVFLIKFTIRERFRKLYYVWVSI